jgi:hypothetical protein
VTKHIIVDGSNIATEGRTEPSLAQLDEAVTALIAEYKGAKITVIVDATFGHRIAKKERAEFETAIANNELVAPPAGAVGRGDAFILAIADKANAAILSNDSYQEFHGKYKWLFDEGRLIGGKPVPLVGWVFVERLPVRGPTSRRSVRTGAVVKKESSASPEASKPMPVPKTPPPNARMKAQPALRPQPEKRQAEKRAKKSAPEKARSAAPIVMANDVVPYLEFVEKHPAGTKVKAVVQSYAANGVTVSIGNVAGYVPLRNMATPIPRSARDVFKIGDTVTRCARCSGIFCQGASLKVSSEESARQESNEDCDHQSCCQEGARYKGCCEESTCQEGCEGGSGQSPGEESRTEKGCRQESGSKENTCKEAHSKEKIVVSSC